MAGILSWDDLEDDSPLKNADNQDIALKAAQNLQNLDLDSAHEEFNQHQSILDKRKEAQLYTLSGTDEELGDILKERAASNLKELTKHLDNGGRVLVDDKQLLNCNSDLNQLVPFKYNWAWSLYLTSTEHHWMPAECSVWDDEKVLKNLPLELNHAFGLWYRFSFVKYRLFNISHLLNCYRLITNPECRQYLLRQGFETSLVSHVEMSINDVFDGRLSMMAPNGAVAIMGKLTDLLEPVTRSLRDRSFNTASVENTQQFITELITASLILNTVIPTILHTAICPKGYALPNITQTVYYMQRDIQTQLTWMTLFITNVFAENPELDKEQVSTVISDVILSVLDLLTMCLPKQAYLLTPLCARYLRDMGLRYVYDAQVKQPQQQEWNDLLSYLNKMKPEVNFEAGLSGTGGALGW